jgi:hypothetical protein
MLKRLVALLLLCAPVSVWAQANASPPLLTAIQGPGNIVKVIPNAPVVVCNYPAQGAGPCNNLAVTYGSPTASPTCPLNAQVTPPGTTTCSGTSDAQGNFGIFGQVGTYVYYFYFQGTWYGPYVLGLGGTGTTAGVNTFNTRAGNVGLVAADVGAAGAAQTGNGTMSWTCNPLGSCILGSASNFFQTFSTANNGFQVSMLDQFGDRIWAGALVGFPSTVPNSTGWQLVSTGASGSFWAGNQTDIFGFVPGAPASGLVFDMNAIGATINLPLTVTGPLTVPSCTGCSVNPYAIDQFQIGTGAGTSTFANGVQGALKYVTSANGGPSLAQAAASDLTNGTTGSGGVVLANNPAVSGATLTNPSANNLTVSGTGATEIKQTATAGICDAPSAGVNVICAGPTAAAPANVATEISIDGMTAATPPIPMVSTSFTTTSTAASGAALTGFTSNTVRPGQTVIGNCSGIYQIATGVASAAFGVSASQAPLAGFYYTVAIAGNTTSGALFSKSGTTNSTVVGLTGSVNAITTNYNWSLSFLIPWNATTAGTFTINGQTGNASDALSGEGVCTYEILN